MGKKSRKNKAASRPGGLRPSWQEGQDALSQATPEVVSGLPLRPLENWCCMSVDTKGVLSMCIMDVTTDQPGRQLVGSGSFIDPQSRQEDLLKALFATMINPMGCFGSRRPSVLMLEPEFEPAFAYIKEKAAAAGISVEMNHDVGVSQKKEAFRQTLLALFNMGRGTTSHPSCTWHDGVRMGATIANVMKLTQNLEGTWKCRTFYDEAEEHFILVIEDLHRPMSATSPPIGIGLCNMNDSADITQGILATMLAPKPPSDRIRPRRIVLEADLEGSFDDIRKHLKEANVKVKMDGRCAACLQPDSSGDFPTCSRCPKVLYCSKDCQRAHWKIHKKVCGKNV